MTNSNLELDWKSTQENDEEPFVFGVKDNYPGSGFIVMLPRNETESLNILTKLQEDTFIDGATRLISIDFNLFNPTSAMHTVTRLIFEFGADGDVSGSFEPDMRLLRYDNNYTRMIFDFYLQLV